MGSRSWHLSRSQRHGEVADYLAEGEHWDWAAVALAYAAHQQVHSVLSGEPSLGRDERHPRKHVSPPGAMHGGRGTNQLVNALFPDDVALAYASLFEMGRRTRYDSRELGGDFAYKMLTLQYRSVADYCAGINASRPDIHTSAP